MKKIFWTTVFWLVVFFGLAFYVKMFNADIAYGVSTWLGAEISTSGELLSWSVAETGSIMSGIESIQTTLADMQTKLNTLVGETTPAVSTIEEAIATGKVTK